MTYHWPRFPVSTPVSFAYTHPPRRRAPSNCLLRAGDDPLHVRVPPHSVRAYPGVLTLRSMIRECLLGSARIPFAQWCRLVPSLPLRVVLLRVFPLAKPNTESRRADSNRLPLLITSWLAAVLVRTIAYRHVSYRRRILGRGGANRTIAYRPVPTRLQYDYSTFWNL